MRCIDKFETKIDSIHSWESGDLKKQRRVYWCFYTVSFLLLAVASLNVYLTTGCAIVWSVDGLEQFYPYFVLEGQWLREIFSNIASGNFQIPMWNFNLGYGTDLLAEMDVFYDPLNLISAFFPEGASEWAFQFLVILRLFLAGITFSLFSLYFKNKRWCTLLSALVYCLSSTALTALHWPGSTWPLILFPLLLLGVEKILNGKSPYLFIGTSFLFFLISWYFAYMATIFVVIYCATRVVLRLKKKKCLDARHFINWFLKIAGFYIIGIALAGFALWPMILDLATNNRATNAETSIPILYSFTYYMDTLTALVGSTTVGSDCYVGYGAFAFLSCVLLLASKGKDTLLKVALLAMIVILLIPFFGSALNGFNYATNRWVWALAFLICFIMAREIPRLVGVLSRHHVKILVTITFAFVVAMFALPWMRNEKTIAGGVVLMAALAICIQKYTNARAKRSLLSATLVAGIILNAFYFTCPEIYGTAKEAPNFGTLFSKITNQSADWAAVQAAETEGDDENDDWRYDADPTCGDRPRNNSSVLGISGINFYNSLYNGNVDEYHTELGITQGGINFSYQNLMGSTMAESLAGVKYYIVPQGKATAPFGYDSTPIYTTVSGEQKYEVYKNKNALGKAFTYDACISRSTYNSLTPLQRQEALLQGAVVEDSEVQKTGVEVITPTTTSSNVNYLEAETVTAQNAGTTTKNIYITDNSFYVLKENSSVTLTFEGKESCETYINFKNFKLNPLNPFDVQNAKAKLTGKQPTLADDVSNLKWLMKWVSPTTVKIGITSDGNTSTKTVSAPTTSNHLYGGKDDWAINLGYSETAQTKVTLTFDKVGQYSFEDLNITCQNVDSVSTYVEDRKQTPVTNYTESTNSISAHVDTDTTQLVYFSTPKTPGWTATVDGEKVDIISANTAFMAVKLEKGSHDIELHFESPGLKEGLITSCAGLLLLIFVVLFRRVKKRKHKQEKQ